LELLGDDDDGEDNNIRATLKPYFEETVSVLESMLVDADEMVDSVKQFHREIIVRGRASMQEQSQENPSLTVPRIAGMLTEKHHDKR
jgi:hypothetical protein